MSLELNMAFEGKAREAISMAPNVVRVTANNPSPYTFHGTNSYIVGTNTLAVIDPGPDDPAHLSALLQAIDGRPVSHIFVSHTHRDHSPLTPALKAATGAEVLAQGPHRAARPLREGEVNPFGESSDYAFAPDRALADAELVQGDGFAIRAIYTPGHCANHTAFALEDTGLLFSADHVMAFATTVVAPPDGSMADFMASLDRLLQRDDRLYLPGHGGNVENPHRFVRGLKAHRKMRERAILERFVAGDRTIQAVVAAIYRDTDPRLHGAAALSVYAHVEDLVARGLLQAEPDLALDAHYRPA
ncbi:MBL fold metallo-hydrolase [Tianweitania sp. BSSL-BM11]|uniref:MBL fold metallo-hydrolase n=1 Tax=Tianweitania aestuarii TaxID=2814886 RepID=A0ABS5RS71_9HYPH|nr:MBL fold metallo-hydrolase [Tianweitania aestuarii]MBS9719812.1 MBL fold metallo-hydrolase [Tianweitania aestuarii]